MTVTASLFHLMSIYSLFLYREKGSLMKKHCWMFFGKFSLQPFLGWFLVCLASRSFDPLNTALISEAQFRKFMKSKDSIEEEDINKMIEGNKEIHIVEDHYFC